MIFTSTPQTNHDPHPNVWNGHTPFNQMRTDTEIYRKGAPAPSAYWKNYIRVPRPEFDGAPMNLILASYRAEVEALGQADPEDWLPVTNHGYLPDVSDEERDHARRVLERLVALR